MVDIPLQCRCGKVTGIAKNTSPSNGNRLVCYCKDCQAFAQILHHKHCTQDSTDDSSANREQASDNFVLDTDGGTEVFQMPPSRLHISKGHEHIACLRLTPKGTYRWYTQCCHTPIGNTLTAGVPFIGLIHSFISLTDKERQQSLGIIRGYIQARDIYNESTGSEDTTTKKHPGMPLLIGLRTITCLALWKLKRLERPNPLFSSEGLPLAKPEIISSKTQR
ncbi:DUF6151 family protein [Aliamphritea ceti]|uniref:DUF6151 family protein n=1 Tax=Aliamphritea ceti TaxID=1524258 RepID=UPI0021C446A7|nr:DUF6151 family protein [Aliamphritea ceti]